jgi:hypothetical protein
MSIESDQEPQGTDTDNTPQGDEQQQAAPQGDSDTGTQPEFDWKAQARKNETALKREREARKDLESKVKQLLTPEEVQSKEQALAEAQREAQAAKTEALRLRIALAEGLPIDLAERLRGEDEEAMREDAATLKALVKTTPPAADAKKAMLADNKPVSTDPNDLLRQIIASR